jgi:hypothetical protein
MQMAAATGALIAPAGVAHARPPHRPGALGCAIALTAIATTTDQHLGPAAGTQEQAARGLHRRSPANAEDQADVRLDGCAMAAILRATQSAVCRSRRLLVDWVPARLRLHFAGLRRRRAGGLFSDPSYPPRRGAAQPGDSSAPRLGYQPVVGKHVFGHPYGSSCPLNLAARTMSPDLRGSRKPSTTGPSQRKSALATRLSVRRASEMRISPQLKNEPAAMASNGRRRRCKRSARRRLKRFRPTTSTPTTGSRRRVDVCCAPAGTLA